MNEYWIYNIDTEEERPIFGYSYDDACERYCINKDEWKLLDWKYVDEKRARLMPRSFRVILSSIPALVVGIRFSEITYTHRKPLLLCETSDRCC